MTLQRVSVIGKVLAQLSPATKPDNISAVMQWAHDALARHQVQAWTGEVAAAITAHGVYRRDRGSGSGPGAGE